MLHRYLNWVGYNTQSFNAGDYRRKVCYLDSYSRSWDTRVRKHLFLILITQQAPSCVTSLLCLLLTVVLVFGVDCRFDGFFEGRRGRRYFWCYKHNASTTVFAGLVCKIGIKFWSVAGMPSLMCCLSRAFVTTPCCWRRTTIWNYRIPVVLTSVIDSRLRKNGSWGSSSRFPRAFEAVRIDLRDARRRVGQRHSIHQTVQCCVMYACWSIGRSVSEGESMQWRARIRRDLLSAKCTHPTSQDMALHPRRNRFWSERNSGRRSWSEWEWNSL